MNIAISNDMGREVVLIADELSRAVELTLNPTIAHNARNQAYEACESFKENSPWCAQAGLLLASGEQYTAVVKHFGLQLMEHTVKYKWTVITQAEKIFIKENAMKLLYMGGWDTGHLNDALARVIVEMIKREWPQQWPTLLAELSDACVRGHQHTQIVLHIFLRLVEDVATLQTLEQNQRRKDIYQALTGNMAEIFAFFMRLIELHVQEFREKTAAGDFNAAASNGRVVQVVLLTLTGFVEWVSTNHVVSNNGRLLQMLCILLQDASFQLPAAECLLQVVNRKGSTKERKPLMILFSEDAISCIHRAALASINSSDENQYLFLKKLSQVLAGIAQQLSSMWVYAANPESWMPVLLETTLLLTSHPSLTLVQTANIMWLAVLKHEQMAKLPQVLAVLPRWLQAAAPKILKVVYPTSRVSRTMDTVSYACMDYDSEEEFTTFFNRCRTEILETFKYCMSAAPLVTWAYVQQWTRAALDKVDSCPQQLTLLHPFYIEWEALSQVLDVVLSRLLLAEPRPDVAEGLQLLQRCVACSPPDPLALSLLLSFISALFVFLSCAYSQLAGPGVSVAGADLLPRVLDKIFAALVFEGVSPEDRRSRAVKNVRRHAASLLVKLGSKYPLLLLPVFGRLHDLCRAAVARADLSAVESVTLQEALLIVSNHLCCFERQSALVAQILGDCAQRWAALGPHLTSAASLVRLLGLESEEASADEERVAARKTLLYALTLTLGVVKRTQVPTDPDKASRGGFGCGVTASGNPAWRNPCAAHVMPLLPHAFALCRALHELAAAGGGATGGAYVQAIHEHSCQLAGAAAGALRREMFASGGPARVAAASLLHALPALPDAWLRPVLRSALKPILHHCPPEQHQQVALPLLDTLSPYMLVHLSQRWEYITSLYESGKLEEEAGSESQEVLEDMMVRHLTREYLDLLKVALVDGGLVVDVNSGDMEEEPPVVLPQRAPEQLSELGNMLLSHPVVSPPILHTILRALTWNDTTSSLRACSLALPALRAALTAGRVSAQDATGAIAAVLQALRTHGQHEANQAALLALAVQMYECLRPLYPGVAGVVRSVPGADAHDVARLDDKMAAQNAKPAKIDKSKRELFKKITSQLIGRNVGQLFKKEVFILNLPSMQLTKEAPRSAFDSPEGVGLENLFNNSKAPT